MKKFGLIMFAFLAMSVCVMAQDENRQRGERQGRMPRFNKEQMVKSMTDRQVERLKLTEKQVEQMKVLNEALVTEMMSQRPQMGQPGEARKEMTAEEREKMRAEREKKMTEMQNNYVTLVKAVLTEEQFTEFEKMQKERPQGFRQGQGGPRQGQNAPRQGQNAPRRERGGDGGNR